MSISPAIKELINKLNQDLTQLEQNTREALDLLRLLLSQFPENTLLIQFFAYLNNVLFFIESYRNRIQRSFTFLSEIEVSDAESQETGEDLSSMLGDIIEDKMRVDRLLSRLRG